jgi:hypothetical protein
MSLAQENETRKGTVKRKTHMLPRLLHILLFLCLVGTVRYSFADDKPTTGVTGIEKIHPQVGASQRCLTCHEDPHAGELGTECQQCHSFPGPWKRSWLLYDHAARARYPLAGGHAALTCSACHKAPPYRSVKRECADCHEDIGRFYRGTSHFDQITTMPSEMFGLVRCEDCHAKDASREHLSQIEGECARCHTPEYAALAAYWQGELFTETDALISETKSLEQKINQTLSGRGAEPLPTDLRITLQNAQRDLRVIEQSLKDLRRTGIHNLTLLHRELSQTKRHLRRITQLLTPD